MFLDSELKTITGVKRDHWVAAAVILLLGMLLASEVERAFSLRCALWRIS